MHFLKKIIYIQLFSDRSPKSTGLVFVAGELHNWFLTLGHLGNLRFHVIKYSVSPLYLYGKGKFVLPSRDPGKGHSQARFVQP